MKHVYLFLTARMVIRTGLPLLLTRVSQFHNHRQYLNVSRAVSLRYPAWSRFRSELSSIHRLDHLKRAEDLWQSYTNKHRLRRGMLGALGNKISRDRQHLACVGVERTRTTGHGATVSTRFARVGLAAVAEWRARSLRSVGEMLREL